MKKVLFIGIPTAVVALIAAIVLWSNLTNPYTPAGSVGYITQGSWFGKSSYVGTQVGPTSTGAGWLLAVQNTDVTPRNVDEDFVGDSAVLSKDNLKLEFRVHATIRVRPERIKDLIEGSATAGNGKDAVENGYRNIIRENFRTLARVIVTSHNGLDVKDNIEKDSAELLRRENEQLANTPFELTSAVVGNVQYPPEVVNAVSSKLAATQRLEQQETEIEIARKQAQANVIAAQGQADANRISKAELSPLTLARDAIEAQKLLAQSPNKVVYYLQVGPGGVPIVNTTEPATPASK